MTYLIMAGESRITLPLAFSRLNWNHTMSPDRLIYDKGMVRRSRVFREDLKGIIFYADVDDKSIESNNLNFALKHNLNCWPNPSILLHMLNRHKVIAECVNNGFVSHKIFNNGTYSDIIKELKPPFVLKVGTTHRGIGKFLINSENDFINSIEEEFTAEPFFIGDSVRALIIDNNIFGIKIINSSSWIKNSPGGEIVIIDLPNKLKEHALSISRYFNLEISGVDYVIDNSGNFHFLEINQYPGFCVSDEAESAAKVFFNKKMDDIERNSN